MRPKFLFEAKGFTKIRHSILIFVRIGFIRIIVSIKIRILLRFYFFFFLSKTCQRTTRLYWHSLNTAIPFYAGSLTYPRTGSVRG